MAKLTFDEAIERITEGRSVSSSDILASALSRTVWLAEWHLPGCMSESQSFCLSKKDAIDAACAMAENENGKPRGMVTALRKHGRFDSNSPMFGTCVNTVSRHRLRDLL